MARIIAVTRAARAPCPSVNDSLAFCPAPPLITAHRVQRVCVRGTFVRTAHWIWAQLAYFFTEHADAAAFLRAVRQNAGGAQIDAQIIGVSLADIIRAYSSEQATAAGETFVLIPTMAEVAAARQILRATGKEVDPAQLGPGSGLVPVYWSEELAVQASDGKQRSQRPPRSIQPQSFSPGTAA